MAVFAFAIASPGGELGLASWYGGPFEGRLAASGEIYHEDQLTAAHRVLPFGTRVRVRRTDIERSVVVRINDRGPYVDSRIIDLSHAAAQELGMVEPGVVPVSVEVIDVEEESIPPPAFAVQVGAFRVRQNALRAQATMERSFAKVRVVYRQRDDLWCVLIGEPASRMEAEALMGTVRRQAGGESAFVVRAIDSPAPLVE